MFKRALVITCILLFSWGSASMAEEPSNELQRYVKKLNRPVKAYVKEIIDDSGKDEIEPGDFRESLEESLLSRKSVKFEVVQAPDQSDVQISCIIRKYQYLERGPLKVSPSAGGMLLDMAATATHNYAEIETEFTVADTRTGKELWKDRINVYIKKVMTPEESVPLVYDKISRIFLWKSFGKPGR